MSQDFARTLRESLADPLPLCEALGLIGTRGTFLRQSGGGVTVRCPWHDENTPSCSVTRGKDGTVRVRCFGCQESGDALTLIAKVRGHSDREFRETLIEAARLAGRWDVLDALEHRSNPDAPIAAPPVAKASIEPEERTYPPASDVHAMLNGGDTCTRHDVATWLASRGLDGESVQELGARALSGVRGGALPRWARYRGDSWRDTGHRLIVPMHDATGALRSVRAARVTDGESPKRLPPAGHKASELVMACPLALAMLRGDFKPERVMIVEGEPDFLSVATHDYDYAVARVGIVSGSWTPAFALRVPMGARVSIWTHADAAGDAYAAEMITMLERWRGCRVRRWNPKEAA